MQYPATIPSTAESRIMRMGCTFFSAKISMHKKIPADTQKSAADSVAIEKPSGKNTVLPVDTRAAPISPITAGFSPDMHPFTIRLF